MRAHRSRSARRLGLTVSAALAAGALLVVLAAHDEADASGALAIAMRPPPAESRATLPVLPQRQPLDVPDLPEPSLAAAVAAAPLAGRIERTVERMAASLRDGPVDRSTWDTEVRALAGSLGPGSIPTLLGLAADGSLPDEQLVAVAELLRPWSAAPGGLPCPLPEPALAALRRQLDESPRRPAATAAARALGALGERSDTARRLDELLDPSRRSLAAWSLQASPTVSILDDLGALLATGIDAESRAAVLTTMEGWARSAPGCVDGPQRDAAADAVAALLDADSIEPGVRQRAACALVALGGASARGAIAKLCRDPAADDELLRVGISALARAADGEALAWLEDGLWNESTPGARRLAFAEGLARIPAPSSARPALLEIALASETTSDQRRALYALGALPPSSDTVSAAALALRGRDPAVRATGIWALDRSALSVACADQLRALGETDSSDEVRRSAQRALARIGPEPRAASP